MNTLLKRILLKAELVSLEKKHKAFQQTKEYKALSADEKAQEDQSFYQVDYSLVWEELEEIKTNRFLKKVHKFNIPYPTRWSKEGKDMWSIGSFGNHYLTTEGLYKLRNILREEQKARRECWLGWVPMVTAWAALVSSATAILTVMRYWNK